MRQSIGMNAQLNLIITFILIVFGLIAASLSYYKAFKVSNVIIDSIEKYEGYNEFSEEEISRNLSTLGYQGSYRRCGDDNLNDTNFGYCVYLDDDDCSYKYDITTYMTFQLPIASFIKIPVGFSTKQINKIKEAGCN